MRKDTDQEILREMLDRAQIIYTEDAFSLTVEGGYAGFVSVFNFNLDGDLEALGAWE